MAIHHEDTGRDAAGLPANTLNLVEHPSRLVETWRRRVQAGAQQATRRWRLPGITQVLGVVILLFLIAFGVVRHPSAIRGVGTHLFHLDIALLLIYGIAAIWVLFQSSASFDAAIRFGTMAGFLLGLVLIANHVAELFALARNFVLIIGPVFLALALLAATGSAAMERTDSLLLATVAGVWCAMTGTLILLCVGFVLNLACEARSELWLRQAFATSGMRDPGGFVIRNTLETASEGLVRMPVIALLLSPLGACASKWIRRRSRGAVLVVIWSALLMFITGAGALWYADSLPRSARPPFILAGVLLASAALSAAHPSWSALRQQRR